MADNQIIQTNRPEPGGQRLDLENNVIEVGDIPKKVRNQRRDSDFEKDIKRNSRGIANV